MRIFCATTNAGKLREFLRSLPATFDLAPLPDLKQIEPPEETGKTFEENAILKAIYYSRRAPELLFAEDSGLEVDALDKAPGVYSARFSGPDATDESNNALLLERLQGVENRAARYVAVIALARGESIIGTFRGEVEGRITEEPRGANGFGYDPLFFYPPFGCTFGEASVEQKISVSHRSRAVEAMAAALGRIGAT